MTRTEIYLASLVVLVTLVVTLLVSLTLPPDSSVRIPNPNPTYQQTRMQPEQVPLCQEHHEVICIRFVNR